ncbi:DUF2758 domain-containing protein [Streptococcus hongkongensis]
MKIKLFYQGHKEKLPDFEARVNEFTQSHNVTDIKYHPLSVGFSIMVLYNGTN